MPTNKLHTSQNVKEQLSGAFLAYQASADLDSLNDHLGVINRLLANDECFVLSPKSRASLAIMGPGPDQQLQQRAMLCEPAHSFRGRHFIATTKGEIVLRASERPGAPWCVLAFHPESGVANFNVAVANQYTSR